MECSQIEEKILTGELGDRELAHIAACDSCRSFQKIHEELMALPDACAVEPPDISSIANAAAARARRRFRLIGSAAGVAAGIAVAGLLAIHPAAAPLQSGTAVNTVFYPAGEEDTDYLSALDTITLSWDNGDELSDFSNAVSAASWRIDVYNPLIMEDL